MNTQISIVPGKNLTKEDIDAINKARLQEFGSTAAINPQPDNEDWTKIYFLAKKEKELVAFGRLHNVKVTFQSQKYDALGIATVVSLEKGKGYGKLLMEEIKNYIVQSGKTGLGFCNQTVTPFYQKCGFDVIREGQNRFYNSTPPRFQNSDAIYIDGKEGLIKNLLEYPSETAEISRPHW